MDANQIVRVLIRDRTRLLGYVWAICRDAHLAEDVFQDVTVLAMERACEIADEQHLMLWARRAARFKTLEILRQRARRPIPLDDDVLDALEEEWDGGVISSADEIDHLRTCMEKLTPRARTLIGMRYVTGISGARVAEVMDIQVQSVYVALARIHRTLRECVRGRRLKGASRG